MYPWSFSLKPADLLLSSKGSSFQPEGTGLEVVASDASSAATVAARHEASASQASALTSSPGRLGEHRGRDQDAKRARGSIGALPAVRERRLSERRFDRSVSTG